MAAVQLMTFSYLYLKLLRNSGIYLNPMAKQRWKTQTYKHALVQTEKNKK